MIKLVNFFVFLLFIPNANAALFENILKCDSSAAGLFNCKIPEHSLDTFKYPFQMKFIVEYEYKCREDLYLQLKFGGEAPHLIPVGNAQGGIKKIELIGTGPLVLNDTDPYWTNESILNRSCQIKIESVTTNLAEASLSIILNLQGLIAESNNQEVVDKKINNAMKAYSQFINKVGGKQKLSCLIKSYIDSNSVSSRIIRDLKNHFFIMYGTDYVSSEFNCSASVNENEIISMCLDDEFSHDSCSDYFFYQKARKWFTDRISKLQSLSKYAYTSDLKNQVKKAIENLELSLLKEGTSNEN